jgi:hypothetical protein
MTDRPDVAAWRAEWERGVWGDGVVLHYDLVYPFVERLLAALEAPTPHPYSFDFSKLRQDMRDVYTSARQSGLDAHAAFECALDEAIP